MALRQVACSPTSLLRYFTGNESQKPDAKIFVKAIVGFTLKCTFGHYEQ